MLGFDKEFINHLDKIRDLDWRGLDLWVFGGIVSNWNTNDIDSLIIGNDIPKGMLGLMRGLGPWDVNWTQDPDSIWFPGNNPIKFKLYTPQDRWIYCKLPSVKQRNRFKHGFKYGKPFKLINKGIIQL